MNNEETNLINGLFERLRTADSAPKDRDAEQLIQQKVAAQPSAPYLMAQTVLVQEQALNNAQQRIKDLEARLAEAAKDHPQSGSGGGSFLSSLFGNKTPSNPPPLPQTLGGGSGYTPGYQQVPPAPSGGSGFLGTALAAAAGVAGGSLLYHGLENMLGNHASAFGSTMGGGSNFMGGGFGGQPTEIVENREVVNNYYDGENRGSGERGGNGNGNDSISNTSNNDDNGPYSTPPHDDPSDSADTTAVTNADAEDNGLYSSPPQDEPGDDMFADNTGNSDFGSGFDDGGGDSDSLV